MDKSVLKIAGIIAIVVGILASLTLIGAIIGIPMIIGGYKIKDISTLPEEEIEKQKDTILIWTIVFLFICQLSGILCLVYYLSMGNYSSSKSSNSKTNNSKYDDLEKLNKLYKDKVITKEEFEAEKKRILNQ